MRLTIRNLNVYVKSAWPTLLSRAPHRLGFGRDRAAEGTWLAANHHLPPTPRQHTQDLFFEFLDHLGVPRGAPLQPHRGLDPHQLQPHARIGNGNNLACGRLQGHIASATDVASRLDQDAQRRPAAPLEQVLQGGHAGPPGVGRLRRGAQLLRVTEQHEVLGTRPGRDGVGEAVLAGLVHDDVDQLVGRILGCEHRVVENPVRTEGAPS